jgi:hypothetical protein
MPQCQFPVFCCFCVSEKLHRKYSRNWTKPNPVVQIFHGASRTPKRRRSRTRGWPHHQGARPTPGLCRPVVWPPWSTSDAASSPIKTPNGKNLKTRSLFKNTSRSTAAVDPKIGRVHKLFPAPCRRGESPPEVFFIAMLASGVMSE